MAWYYGTFSCGHEGRVNIIGPGKDREWKKERAFGELCPECYKKWLEEERRKANLEAAEKSSEMELPELIGTEKQVAWANTLRMEVIENYEQQQEEFNERIEKAKELLRRNEENGIPNKYSLSDLKLYVRGREHTNMITTKEELSDTMDYILQSKTKAEFWIDNRYKSGEFWHFIEGFRKYVAENGIPEDVKREEIEIKESLTVAPETENLKSGVVEITYKENVLYARYVKDDDFIKIVKDLNYKWEGVWCKEITEYTGDFEDRAAELGNILLANGFTVRFQNTESKEMAISANFEPENDRWVKYNSELQKLAIVWKRRSDALYESAKKLPGAKWSSGSMKVKVEFYKEVEDFAETMGFSISQRAKEEIERYKQKESGFETASISEKAKESTSDKERIEKSLKSDGTIIKDLVDE